jgi:hypothetical protein
MAEQQIQQQLQDQTARLERVGEQFAYEAPPLKKPALAEQPAPAPKTEAVRG